MSDEVCTATPRPPAVKPPMVKPVIVTTNADAGMAAPDVVMTTAVALVALHVPFNPATLPLPAATVGVRDGAKKPEGKLSVMLPPGSTRIPGVKLKVTGTAFFPTLRSDKEMVKALIEEREGEQVNPSPMKPTLQEHSPL